MSNSQLRSLDSNTSVSPETLSNGRYQIDGPLGANAFGAVVTAMDTSNNQQVCIQLLNNQLASRMDAVQALLQSASTANQVAHKNVLRTLDAGSEGDCAYLVTEALEGLSLAELLTRKQTANTAFSAAQVGNILTQLCAAVEACSKIGGHGAVTLESVFVDTSGQLKLGGLGLGILAPAVSAELGARLSPETCSGSAPSSQADVYGVGALAYELLVGQVPQMGCQRPSEACPELSSLVDQFVGATTNPNKDKRPAVGQLAGAAQKALSTHTSPVPRQSAGHAEQSERPSLAQAISAPRSAQQAQISQSHSVQAALSQALSETRERWLVSKGRLDYGPFSMADIVEQIRIGEIVPGNILIDNDTGERASVEKHPLLFDIVDAARQKREDERRANAEVVHAKQERTQGVALYAIIAVVVLGLGGGAYVTVKALSSDEGEEVVTIASLEDGSFEAKISFPDRAQAKKRRAKHRKSRGKSDGPPGTEGGWDNTTNLDLGGPDQGSERLSSGQISPVLRRASSKLGRCLKSTSTRGALIEFVVKGSGKVSQVRVNMDTQSAVAKCVRKVMMDEPFPSFNGTRSSHTFNLNL